MLAKSAEKSKLCVGIGESYNKIAICFAIDGGTYVQFAKKNEKGKLTRKNSVILNLSGILALSVGVKECLDSLAYDPAGYAFDQVVDMERFTYLYTLYLTCTTFLTYLHTLYSACTTRSTYFTIHFNPPYTLHVQHVPHTYLPYTLHPRYAFHVLRS